MSRRELERFIHLSGTTHQGREDVVQDVRYAHGHLLGRNRKVAKSLAPTGAVTLRVAARSEAQMRSSPVVDPLAPAPEPAFEFDQTVTW